MYLEDKFCLRTQFSPTFASFCLVTDMLVQDHGTSSAGWQHRQTWISSFVRSIWGKNSIFYLYKTTLVSYINRNAYVFFGPQIVRVGGGLPPNDGAAVATRGRTVCGLVDSRLTTGHERFQDSAGWIIDGSTPALLALMEGAPEDGEWEHEWGSCSKSFHMPHGRGAVKLRSSIWSSHSG